MLPYAIGGILLLFAVGAGGAAALKPGQEKMMFVNYAWITLLPSTHTLVPNVGPGTLPANIPATLPPPPGVTSPGRWVEFPQGYESWGGTGQATPPGGKGNPIIPIWPNVPPGMSVFEWRPGPDKSGPDVTNPSPTGAQAFQIYKINGYYVCNVHGVAKNPSGMNNAQGILQFDPAWQAFMTPPPPPGETAHSGKWHGVRVDLLVWLTPTNTNNATQALVAYQDPQLAAWLAQNGAGGGITATNPVFGGAATGVAAPTYVPSSGSGRSGLATPGG